MLAGLCILSLAALPSAGQAMETVNVTLEDASDSGVDAMKMTAIPDHVKAGRIVIHATNESKSLTHETLVVGPLSSGAKLPYDDKTGELVERRIPKRGEISDLAPGKSGSLTVNLKPGTYQLICNEPNHYKSGMWTTLKVTP
ncbi:MAG: hypothetical protein JO227_07965 [Acetobacteraceae bacterium]|nr:hypothetical protein [Acetobacteraceae bacterium]